MPFLAVSVSSLLAWSTSQVEMGRSRWFSNCLAPKIKEDRDGNGLILLVSLLGQTLKFINGELFMEQFFLPYRHLQFRYAQKSIGISSVKPGMAENLHGMAAKSCDPREMSEYV